MPEKTSGEDFLAEKEGRKWRKSPKNLKISIKKVYISAKKVGMCEKCTNFAPL